jgi:hypothetical protein
VLDIVLKPLPREPIPHWLARHIVLFDFASTGRFIKGITGSRHRGFASDLPTRLQELANQIQSLQCTPDFFIEHHTLFPYYRPFLPSSRATRVREFLLGSRGGGIHMLLGLMASNVPLTTCYRFCSQCAEEDRKQFSECYWHLEHQLPGVLVCPQHGIPLASTQVRLHQLSRKYELVTAEEVLNGTLLPAPVYQRPIMICLQEVARNSFWLLTEAGGSPLDAVSIRERYVRLLVERQLATHSGRIRVESLMTAFLAYFPDDFLELLHCPLLSRNDNWLLRLFRYPNTAFHPLYHLLLLQFLGITAEAFFNHELKPPPFGREPWPCLNRLCDQYKCAVISNCQITFSKDSGRPVGLFQCPACGYIYSRVGPDKAEADLYRRSHIVRFGALWDRTLEENWLKADISLRQLSKMLGVDPRTVERQLPRLGLPRERPGTVKATKNDEAIAVPSASVLDRNSKLAQQRNRWLEVIKSHPELNTTNIRTIYPALYVWLYRHDRDWLQQNLQHSRPRSNADFRRVDWPLRDLEFAHACLRAAMELLEPSQRLVHITRTAVIRKAGCLAVIEKHQSKLPLTGGLLGRVCESRDGFAIRRVWRTAQRWKRANDSSVVRWQLVRESGTSRVETSPDVSDAVDQALAWLNEARAGRGNTLATDRIQWLNQLLKLSSMHLRPKDEGQIV